MNLSTLTHGEAWMTPEELDLNRAFIRATTEYLATRNVQETPLITLRVNDVIVTWLLARRLETALTPPEGEPAPCPTLAQAGAIGKCRDRLRRAIKELEACCPRNTAPSGPSLTNPFFEFYKPAQSTTPPIENSNPDTTKSIPRESGTGVPPVMAPENASKPETTKSIPRESGTGVSPVMAPRPGPSNPTTKPQPKTAPHNATNTFSPLVLTWKDRERPPLGWRT